MRGEEDKFRNDSEGACSDNLKLGELSESPGEKSDPRPSYSHILRGLSEKRAEEPW